MTQEQIDKEIQKYNKLAQRRDGLIDPRRLARIAAKLEAVPPGQDNRVDLLLGRKCAVLEPRAEYDLTLREKLAEVQRRDFDDDYILEHWPLCAAACQIRSERIKANAKWSSDAERREWHDVAATQAAQAAQQKEDDFLTHIADQYDDMMDFLRICGDLAL